MVVDTALMFVFPALMIFAGVTDIFTMTISNRLPIAIAAAFVCLAPFAGFSWDTIALHVATGAVMLLLAIALFAPGWIGGGDAKLFAAASLWMGHEYIYQYAMVTALCGGVLTLAILGLRMVPLPAGLAGQKWISRLHRAGCGVPYGVALAVAGLIVYPHTAWLQALG